MKGLLSTGLYKEGARGFTLPEVIVALVLSTFVMLGGGEILRQMVTASHQNTDATVAVIEVQNAAFWLSNDAVQAQEVVLGDPATGFPLTFSWTDWESTEHDITYSMVDSTDELGRNLWEFMRYDNISDDTIMIAQFLDPGETNCDWHSTLENVLVFEVVAKVGTESERRTYEIQPRPLK